MKSIFKPPWKMNGLSEYEMKLSVVLPLCKVKRVPGRWEEKCCWEKKSGVELKNNRTLKLKKNVRKPEEEETGEQRKKQWTTPEQSMNISRPLCFSHTHTFIYTHIKYIDNIGKKWYFGTLVSFEPLELILS